MNEWRSRHDAAFASVKTLLTTAPTLTPFDQHAPTKLHCDASEDAIGAVLTQDQGRDYQPVAYESRKLTDAEKNYPVHEKELLAIVHALAVWRHYLEGIHFKCVTDHQSLKYINTQPTLSKRQARWVERLQQFDFDIEYKPGTTNVVADALSRIPHTAATISTTTTDEDIKSSIQEHLKTDPVYTKILHDIMDGRRVPDTIISGDGLMYDTSQPGLPRLYVPENTDVRTKILHEAHDTPTAAHFGVEKTLERISRSYFWPNMRKTVETYVHGCDACQRHKVINAKPAGLLAPLPIPKKKWFTITMDLITKLPKTKTGQDAIIVFVDKLTKMVHYAATRSTCKATDVAKIFIEHVARLHGLPRTIISDRDPRFTGNFWRALFRALGTKLAMSSAYHPQTDGQTERANRTLEENLRAFVNTKHNDWDEHLPIMEFAYNNSVNASTGFTPFYLNYGFHPRMPGDLDSTIPSCTTPEATTFLERLKKDLEQARANLEKAQEQQRNAADKHRRPSRHNVGDQVLLSTANLDLRLPGQSRKLLAKWIGPFKIVKAIPPVAYKLDLPTKFRGLHPVFHTSLLRPYHDGTQDFPTRTVLDRPLPDIDADGIEDYEVECILGKQLRRQGRRRVPFYLVKWKGYPESDNSWEPRACFDGTASDILAEFEAALASRPRSKGGEDVRVRP